MASRVNTRFVLILVLVVMAAVAIVGGLWFLKIRTDATRHVRTADEYMQQGEYRMAMRFYERALGKEPSNLEFLGYMENALLQIQPDTANEAQELYGRYISVLRHAATHHPTNPEFHLRLLREVHRAARLSRHWGYWSMVAEAAEDMLVHVPEMDPNYPYAKFYLGAARIAPAMRDRWSPEEIEEGKEHLRAFLRAVPDSDICWSALLRSQLGEAQQLLATGQGPAAVEQTERVRQTLAEARENVTDGPEVLIAACYLAAHEYQTMVNPDDPMAEAQVEAIEARVKPDVERLVALVQAQPATFHVYETTAVLGSMSWIEGLTTPLEFVDEYLQGHPDDHLLRASKAELHLMRGEYDEAEAAAQAILDAPLLTVGFISQFQPYLKRYAAKLNVDIAFDRWQEAEASEKAAWLSRMEEVLQYLEDNFVTDPENDPLYMEARAKLAYAQRDYTVAANLFDRILRDELVGGPEMMQLANYAAYSMEQLGEIGRALQHVDRALKKQPGNPYFLGYKARLLLQMREYPEAAEVVVKLLGVDRRGVVAPGVAADIAGRLMALDAYESASAIAARWLELDPENETAARLRQEAEAGAPLDPVLSALNEAQKLYDNGDRDGARRIMEEALSRWPDDQRLLDSTIRFEMIDGEVEAAGALIERAKQLYPDDPRWDVYLIQLRTPDPVERYKGMATLRQGEMEQALYLLSRCSALARTEAQRAAELEAAGKTDEAAAARDVAARARREAQVAQARAEQQAPDHPGLIEHTFQEALREEDWDRAKQIMGRAKELDADQAGGALFEGRLHAMQGDHEEAVRAFRQVTERKPYSAVAWRFLAASYRDLGNFGEALTAFERAFSINPLDFTTVIEYARLLDQRGEDAKALEIARHGHRLRPDDEAMWHSWLLLEAQAGDRSVVLRERRERYDSQPDDRANAMALAGMLGTVEPSRETVLDEDGEARYSVERWARLSGEQQKALLARERQRWYAQADEMVRAMAPEKQRGEEALRWTILRANLMRARGEISEGLQVLREWFAEQDESEEKLKALLAVAQYQGQVKREDEAVETLKEARQYQTDQPLADLALAEVLFAQRRRDEAVTYYESVPEDQRNAIIDLRIVECYTQMRRFGVARERLEAMRRKYGTDKASLLLEGSILDGEAAQSWSLDNKEEAERKVEEFDRVVAQAQALDPTDPRPHVLRARSLLMRFYRTGEHLLLDDANTSLTRAQLVDADFLETMITRVQVLKAKEDFAGAIMELSQVLEQQPDLDDARRELVTMLRGQGRPEAAVEVLRDAVKRHPEAEGWRKQLVDMLVATQRPDEAVTVVRKGIARIKAPNQSYVFWQKELGDLLGEQYLRSLDVEMLRASNGAYERALQVLEEGEFPIWPELILKRAEVLSAIAEDLSRQAHTNPDYTAAIALLERYREEVEKHPILLNVRARILNASGDRAAALDDMGRAHGLIMSRDHTPEEVEQWFTGLKSIFNPDEVAEVDAFVMSMSEETPSLPELMALAKLWKESGKEGITRAVEVQRMAIEHCPAENDALLAHLYSGLGVYLLTGDRNEEALEAFLKVVAIDPEAAEAWNNAAWLAAGPLDDPQQGLEYAQKAVELKPSDWAVIDTLGWVYYRLGDYQHAQSELYRSVRLMEMPANHMHLAEVFAAQGDTRRAIRYLERAHELNEGLPHPDRETRKEIQELLDDIRTSGGDRQ